MNKTCQKTSESKLDGAPIVIVKVQDINKCIIKSRSNVLVI